MPPGVVRWERKEETKNEGEVEVAGNLPELLSVGEISVSLFEDWFQKANLGECGCQAGGQTEILAQTPADSDVEVTEDRQL